MLDRLGYNQNHCIAFFSVKYPFISTKNANNENPLKSSFEALNYYTGLRASHAKANHSTAQIFFLNLCMSVGMILGNIALFCVYEII